MISVSLIITHFNQLSYLKELLKYVAEHNAFSCKEVIVIDDHSLEDAQVSEIQKVYPNYIFIRNEKNLGPSYSRNLGVRLSNCKYLQFLDADDWITSDKIKLQYKYAEENGSPSFICSDWARSYYNSTFEYPIIVSEHIPILNKPKILSIMAHFIPLMAGLIKKESFSSVEGFDEQMRWIEDVNLLIRICNIDDNIIYKSFQKNLFFYRVGNTSSLSNSNKLEFNKAVLKNYKLCFELLSKTYTKKELDAYRLKTFEVLWHIYLNASAFNYNNQLLNDVIELIKITPFSLEYLRHGKKFILAKIIGYKTASLLIRKWN
ncbi:glycosyltransferase family 2 protein [Pedobacter sp.]|uniref:glycosyltransferase family 2 protein n=1 Tax=Pedobacter sp. TaxID=1411316 RepID=UPI0031D30602